MPALVLTGNLKAGPSTGSDAADRATATEMGDEIWHFEIQSEVDQIEVKQTMGIAKSVRGGAIDYKVVVSGYSNDVAGAFAYLLWTTCETDTGVLFLCGSMRQAAISATNPIWCMQAQISEASFGGEAEGLSEFSGTYGLRAAPTQYTV